MKLNRIDLTIAGVTGKSRLHQIEKFPYDELLGDFSEGFPGM